ncbi:hypothetical protein [Altererythrobacter aquiaggeris]|uniref:hypothetical protein n=1 Tax=Aestuarierythrobacter aquiaggeris TaxID=1898396 RepID=UPI0030170961
MQNRFRTVLTASAVLALAACSDSDPADTAAINDVDNAAAGMEATDVGPTDTTVVPANGGEDSDRVTIDADGVTADIADGDKRIKADVSSDPSVTVEVD